MRDRFFERLGEMAAKDSRVFLITGDLGFGALDKYVAGFPKQFLNCGVAEQNMTGIATGMALEGRVVYTYSIGNFPTLRCLEQVRNDAAYHGADVKIVCIGGGFSYGTLGMSHHATEDLGIMRSLGIPTIAPGCLWETSEATEALAKYPGTCYLRLDKSSAGDTSRPGEAFVIGKARELRRGEDVTLIATGGILGLALSAATDLAQRLGITTRVLSMHTVLPLDNAAVIAASRQTGGIVTIEEHTVNGGLGSAVAELLMESGNAPRAFQRVGLRSGFSSIVGSQEYLRGHYSMDERAIVSAAMSVARGFGVFARQSA
ncbi:MAG: transketolase [Gemmatimonadaceae bacterium]|nr:transketolase [Gemmatimonadaceae bacterium]